MLANTKPFILITGDDSIRSEGTILIKRIVAADYDYQIIATKEQQSGVGAKLSLTKAVGWGKELVDGHEAIWVDGTPADAVYFALEYLQRKPDLIISGVNMGSNLSEELFVSGTVCAATIGANLGFKALAFSLVTDPLHWHKDHTGDLDISFLDYPGKIARRIIDQALHLDFPKKTFWNINFPQQKTEEIRVVKAIPDPYYIHDLAITEGNFHYNIHKLDQIDPDTDAGTIQQGFIAITPCKARYTELNRLAELKGHLEG
ncbi:MAG: 5'/3'-nucleotidase SurE [bacterium]